MVSGAASSGLAGVQGRTSSKVCSMCTPSCLPAPPAHFTKQQSSYKAGADHQARWAGALEGEGSMLGVRVRRGEDVDLRWWRGWRCLGERERWWRGLGMEDGYGRRGEREGEVDMGRGGALGGPWGSGSGGGGCLGWWMGMGGGGNREPGRACPGRGRWTWGGGGVPGGAGESGSGGGGGWGWGSRMARGGRGMDMGRRCRSWWRPGEQEQREHGSGGSWWCLGGQEGREWVVEARWPCG